MRHIEFARRTNEENIQRKEDKKEFYKKKKEQILSSYGNLTESARKEIFNPETDHPEDAPEITKEGYSFAKNRFFVARDFFSQSHINWTEHMFKFQEQRKQYFREEHIIAENFDDKGKGLDTWVSKGMPFPNYGETFLLMYQKKVEDLFGEAAKARVKELMGESIVLKTQINKNGEDMKGKFGRILGDFKVYHSSTDSWRMLTEILVEEGHAVAYFGGSKEEVQAKRTRTRTRTRTKRT